MLDLDKEINKQDSDKVENTQVDLKKIKRRNAVNRFLKSYFKFFVALFILYFLWLSFRLLIQPKFEEITYSTNDVLIEKREELSNKYITLKKYQGAVQEFSEISSDNKYKIKRMVPDEYSRDDLFVEVVYFLMENNFSISSVEVSDPLSSLSSDGRDSSGRRVSEDSSPDPSYVQHRKSLPSEVGAWLIDININQIGYPRTKHLLETLENNLKLVDVFSLDFRPEDGTVNIKALSYYYKNN